MVTVPVVTAEAEFVINGCICVCVIAATDVIIRVCTADTVPTSDKLNTQTHKTTNVKNIEEKIKTFKDIEK